MIFLSKPIPESSRVYSVLGSSVYLSKTPLVAPSSYQKPRQHIVLGLLVTICCLSLSNLACAYRKSTQPSRPAPTTQNAPADPHGRTSQTTTDGQPSQGAKGESLSRSTAERKIIRNATFHLALERYETFAQHLESHLKTIRGYIFDLSLSRASRGVSNASLVVKVPSAVFPGFLEWLRKQGEVTYERLTGEDITSQYFDLQTRLHNQKKLEQRLLGLLQQKTASLKDVIAVERELSRVRGQIEQMEGQTRLWNRLVALATIHLQIVIKQPYESLKKPSFAARFRHRIHRSWREFVQFMEDVTLGFATALPWLILALIVIKFWRWRRKRKANQEA